MTPSIYRAIVLSDLNHVLTCWLLAVTSIEFN
jgi:hypothetical protein